MANQDHQMLVRRLRPLYQDYRTALLNRKYYGHKLEFLQRVNLGLEVLLAISTSSAIGGWAIWKNDLGSNIWAIFTAFAAILAILKSILNIGKRIEKYSKLFTGHSDVYYDLQEVVRQIESQCTFTPNMDRSYQKALERRRQLAGDDDPKPNDRLRWRYYHEVNKEIPPRTLWVPS